MKLYISPAVEIIEYSLDDVIAASQPINAEGEGEITTDVPIPPPAPEPVVPDVPGGGSLDDF